MNTASQAKDQLREFKTAFGVHNVSYLEALPPTTWLVKDLIPERGVSTLFAQPKKGKTFYSLHVAFWAARNVGPVAYIVGEGMFDVGPRAKAWRKLHDTTDTIPAEFITKQINIRNPETVNQLIAGLKLMKPRLVVFDTAMKSAIGASDIKQEDVDQIFDVAWRIVGEVGCAVLLVHHAGHNESNRTKGSINWIANSDVIIECDLAEAKGRPGEWILTLSCGDTRKGRKWLAKRYLMKEMLVDGQPDPVLAIGREINSVLDMPVSAIKQPRDVPEEEATVKAKQALVTFRSRFATTGCTAEQWIASIHEDHGPKGWARATAFRVFKFLVDCGAVRSLGPSKGYEKGTGVITGQSQGEAIITPQSPVSSSHISPPKGGEIDETRDGMGPLKKDGMRRIETETRVPDESANKNEQIRTDEQEEANSDHINTEAAKPPEKAPSESIVDVARREALEVLAGIGEAGDEKD
jgi:hypothetical protein